MRTKKKDLTASLGSQLISRRTGVLLVNTGTPDSTAVKDVRKYLRQFLSDERVIDIPFIPRWLLVNLIIAPFRSFSSSKLYQRIWTARGSPLKFHGQDHAALLQQALGDDYKVSFAMRYQNPSMDVALEDMYRSGVDHIILIPLFPQYASASAGSVIDRFMKIVSGWWRFPHISIVSAYWEDEHYLRAWQEIGQKYLDAEHYDHVVFSYHGVPERHVLKGDCGQYCKLNDACCGTYNANNKFCYRAQCLQTSRALAQRFGLKPDQYETVFQSRLGSQPWLKPYFQDKIDEFVAQGLKKVLVFSPSFVADCLETSVELGMEYKEEFMQKGGTTWTLVPSLNTSPLFVQCLKEMVLKLDQARR